jgi:hypothetical protein
MTVPQKVVIRAGIRTSRLLPNGLERGSRSFRRPARLHSRRPTSHAIQLVRELHSTRSRLVGTEACAPSPTGLRAVVPAKRFRTSYF